jgi:hypothetical protein
MITICYVKNARILLETDVPLAVSRASAAPVPLDLREVPKQAEKRHG